MSLRSSVVELRQQHLANYCNLCCSPVVSIFDAFSVVSGMLVRIRQLQVCDDEVVKRRMSRCRWRSNYSTAAVRWRGRIVS